MDKLALLEQAKKDIEAEIKAAKKERGNWFQRTWHAHELRAYRKLQKKFDGVEICDDTEEKINKQLDHLEAILDQTLGEQCSQPA